MGPVYEPPPSSLGKRKRSTKDDGTDAIRARDAAGPSRIITFWDTLGDSTDSEDGNRISDLEPALEAEPEVEAEMEIEDHASDCVELVNVKSWPEVLDLTSDSDEDPSEGASG